MNVNIEKFINLMIDKKIEFEIVFFGLEKYVLNVWDLIELIY